MYDDQIESIRARTTLPDGWFHCPDERNHYRDAMSVLSGELLNQMAGHYSASGLMPNAFAAPAMLMKQLYMRLRIPEGGNVPGFEFIAMHKSGETVFVFGVVDGKSVTLEDDWATFPSDRRVSQIRLIKG